MLPGEQNMWYRVVMGICLLGCVLALLAATALRQRYEETHQQRQTNNANR